MRVLVCGSRSWLNWAAIYRELASLADKNGNELFLIEGGAKGADRIAARLAEGFEWEHHTEYANWNKYGRAAGPIRNLKMLEWEPDIVLAFWDGSSKGTAHMIRTAREAGVEVQVYNS